MTWNQGYTQKKQKEMNKAIRESNKQIKKKLKKQSNSSYRSSYGGDTTSTWSMQQEKRRKEKMLWVIGWIIIGLVSVIGISSIVWVSMNI